MSDQNFERRVAAVRGIATPVIAAVAIVAYVSSPLLRFADANLLYAAGTFLALGTFLTTLGLIVDDSVKLSKTTKIGLVLGAIGFFGMLAVFTAATQASDRTNRQCGLLERDMMALHPSRSDSHDIYSALGCVQQSAGTITFADGGRFR